MRYIKRTQYCWQLGEIYVLAETSGRFDHIIGNINTLYKSDKLVGNIQVMNILFSRQVQKRLCLYVLNI